MPVQAWRWWRGQLAAALLLIAASMAGFALHVHKPVTARSAAGHLVAGSPVLPPFPDCTDQRISLASNTALEQNADGTFTGCLRAGALTPGSYLVTLETGSSWQQTGTTDPNSSIKLSPSHGGAGTLVTVTGLVSERYREQRMPDHVTVCWDSCDGLVGSPETTWSAQSSGSFRLQFHVPAVPWRDSTGVHPLVPGSYRVILPCLGQFDKPPPRCTGIRLASTFQLDGPASALCGDGRACTGLELSPSSGPAGSVIAVRGWVPLVGLDGDGFLNLSLRTSLIPSVVKAGYTWAVPPPLASTIFQVTGSPAWASLGVLHPVSIVRSGMEAMGVDPTNPSRFAYCSQNGIRLTGDAGRSWSTISIKAAYAASTATNYPLTRYSGWTPPTCGSVALDPAHASSLYVEFSAAAPGGPPPSYFVAYFTTDRGRTWHPVPVPAGSDMGAFGGFRVDSTAVRALYFTQTDAPYGKFPPFAVPQTTDGGRTWNTGSLACPAAGPCVALGPQTNARCMAVEEWESVEVSVNNGRSWSATNQVGACWRTREVVGLADGRLLTLGAGEFALTVSQDGDRTWENIDLPRLPVDIDPDHQFGNLVILPDGRLLSATGHWALLEPRASAWCLVPGTPISNLDGSRAPLLVANRLWWFDDFSGALRSLALSALHC
jgi:hypothetical protein